MRGGGLIRQQLLRRVMLRRLLILCLVMACFMVILANRLVTSSATEGFHSRIAASLHQEAIVTFPLLRAQEVSRGHADAAHIAPWISAVIGAAYAGEPLSLHPFSRQFASIAALPEQGVIEIITTDPGFAAAWGVEFAGDLPLDRESCLIGRALWPDPAQPLPDWLYFGDTGCAVTGVFAAEPRPPFLTLERAVLRLLSSERVMVSETTLWSGYMRAASRPQPEHEQAAPSLAAGNLLHEELLRARLAPLIEVGAVEIWSSQQYAARAAEILAIFAFVAQTVNAIALGICVFAIATTFLFSVSEQRREIAIRRAIGATQWRVMTDVLREIALLVLLALMLGYYPGQVLGLALLEHMVAAGILPGSGVHPPPPLYMLSLAAMFLGAGVLAGLLPAIAAARIDPALILRSA